MLNGSGAISLGGNTLGNSVNLELHNAATATVSMSDGRIRALADALEGPVSLSALYGKTYVVPEPRLEGVSVFSGASEDGFFPILYSTLLSKAQNRSFYTEGFKITAGTKGTLYYNAGSTVGSPTNAITNFTDVIFKSDGIYVSAVKVSGLDPRLYWKGGAIGSVGGYGSWYPDVHGGGGGGGGGRVLPGSGGAGAVTSYGIAYGGGAGGGGNYAINWNIYGWSATGASGGGGGWGAAGGNGDSASNYIAAASGGGGNQPGQSVGNQACPGSPGGPAIITNGHAVTWISNQYLYGAVV